MSRCYRCLRCQITGDAGRIGDTGATDYRWWRWYRCYYRWLTLQMPPCMGQGVVTQGSAHSASMQAAVRLQSASRPHDTRDP